MAYVVARPGGRFEIRESVHVPGLASGPRSRSLANFRQLTDEVLDKAADRAQRPFDRDAVVASALARGATWAPALDGAYADLVASSRRMAASIDRSRRPAGFDPGRSLVELIALAEEVARHQPARPSEPLEFPVLARLRDGERSPARR